MSNADRRSVTTDALDTLGTIIDASQKRDAIHLAVEPVVADSVLRAGQYVGLTKGVAHLCEIDKAVGIVDPFLRQHVQPGQMFWLVVLPRQINSLRHVWTHPAFPDAPELADITAEDTKKVKAKNIQDYSEIWVRNFCATHDCPGYETLVESVMRNHDPNYLTIIGEDAHGIIPSELWDHLEKAIGKPITARPEHFNCSC